LWLNKILNSHGPAFCVAGEYSLACNDSQYRLHLAATVGVIWLLIMLSLTLTDYFTRGWVPLNH
jgi:hypothetical protein